MVSTALDKRGQRLTNQLMHFTGVEELLLVVQAAYSSPFTTRSVFARTNAEYVAIAASLGLITTEHHLGYFSNVWRVTPTGLLYMEL